MASGLIRLEDGEEWDLPEGGRVWRWEQALAPGGGLPQVSTSRVRPERPPPGWAERTCLVPGVGPVRQRRLREQGFGDLVALQRHPVWGEGAARAWRHLQQRRVEELRRRRVPDGEMLSLFGPGELLFLDVETLGLAPVFPLFLAGMARWEAGSWRFTLVLARRPDEEAALLRAVERGLEPAAAVVTYNGRAFDLPFVRSRRAYHGASGESWPAAPVLDLLPEARRRFQGVLPDARLETVDRYLTAGRRPSSIPSSMVPEYYRMFVQTGEADWIEPVLEHNLLDLQALIRLWGQVAGQLASLASAV